MTLRRFLFLFDFPLFGVVVLLALIGAAGVYSAGLGGEALYQGQLFRIFLGLLVCFAVMYFDYHLLVNYAPLLYGASIVVLVGVLIFGEEVNGSRSWISLFGMRLQPSELTKIVIILCLCWFLSEFNRRHLSGRELATLGLLVGVPVFLIILQRDLGTAIMYAPIAVGIALVAGVRTKWIIGLLVLGLLATPVVWLGLKDYQRQRVLVTIDPDRDPQGVGYQTRQSQIAIGSGGLLGRGIGQGMQSQLGFVPESHTDFIFALLAEETGFLGGSLILILYAVLLWRLIALAEMAPDAAGILILSGVACMVFSHIVVNVGMALGVLPAIGIPLPLLSYGGSSILTTFLALGLAFNVGLRRYVYL